MALGPSVSFSLLFSSFVRVCTCGGGGCRRRRIEWMKHPPRPVSAMASSCVFQTAALFSPHLLPLSQFFFFHHLLLLLYCLLLYREVPFFFFKTPLCLSWLLRLLLLLRLIFFSSYFRTPRYVKKNSPSLFSLRGSRLTSLKVQDE